MAQLIGIAVHPAIGIARVGNSNDFFVGPEQIGPNSVSVGGYKDRHGKIKKQAARFRVFAKFNNGNIEEHTEPVEWTVELTNKKAAVTGFNSSTMRNASAGNRSKLEIMGRVSVNKADPIKSISGKFEVTDVNGATIGSPLSVTLGEARIQSDGQLLVLGGSGEAFSVTAPQAPLHRTFNNDLWCDDTSDGSVTAEITINGTKYKSTAWLIVAPPKFAPQLTPVVSLWDRLLDAHAKPPADLTPSYTRHIWPILERARTARWVNKYANAHFQDWATDPIYDQTRAGGKLLREHIFECLKGSRAAAERMPLQSTGTSPPDADSNGDRLTDTQLAWMRKWSEGNFGRDWTCVPGPKAAISPSELDRAALDECIGAALWPGIEAGQYLLRTDIWDPFPRLNPRVVKPGDVTAGMALPWHTDFRACGENWWPVARPHHVRPERMPNAYKDWIGHIRNNRNMVDDWHTLGFVIQQGASL